MAKFGEKASPKVERAVHEQKRDTLRSTFGEESDEPQPGDPL
jgi:hypothetical protein